MEKKRQEGTTKKEYRFGGFNKVLSEGEMPCSQKVVTAGSVSEESDVRKLIEYHSNSGGSRVVVRVLRWSPLWLNASSLSAFADNSGGLPFSSLSHAIIL